MRMMWAGYMLENPSGGAYDWRVNVGATPYIGSLTGCKAWIRRRGWLHVSGVPKGYAISHQPYGVSMMWVVKRGGRIVSAFADEQDAIGWCIGKEHPYE